jgi:UDP-glucose-4-epimerase GalE
MLSILVTGGAGYIGSQTMHILKAQGFAPVCFDNLSTGFREFVGDHSFVEGDLGRPADLEAAFSSHNFTAVVHFASHALVEESYRNPHKYYHDNILNTLNLLEAMRKHGVSCIVFSSSCATYGIPDSVPIDESVPLNPVNPYGMTKMVIERILRDYQNAYGMRSVSLRYFNAAGAAHDRSIGELHVPETHLIPRLLEIARTGSADAEVYGNDYPTTDGTCIRDYVHVLDLADAHAAALQYLFAGRPAEVFNLGTGEGYSVLQVIDQARRSTGMDIPIRCKDRRPGDPPRLVANPEKVRAVLGWRARHSSLNEIVETAWNWHQGTVCRALAARCHAA